MTRTIAASPAHFPSTRPPAVVDPKPRMARPAPASAKGPAAGDERGSWIARWYGKAGAVSPYR